MKTCAIIVAAGSGRRFGGRKQFFMLRGRPVVIHALEAVRKICGRAVLVLPSGSTVSFRKRWLKRQGDVITVPGGSSRCESVLAGLNAVPDSCDYVCIHDGARPLIEPRAVRQCLRAAKKHGAAVCAARATDTVKRAGRKGKIEGTLDRNDIWLVQTPQVFRKGIILEAYRRLGGRYSGITDDAMVAEKAGIMPVLVQNNSENIKITKKRDIISAHRILLERKRITRI